MNATKTPTVVVFEGPGFADQGDLISELKHRRINLVRHVMGQRVSDKDVALADSADVVLLRGPWVASAEEKMLCCLLARRLGEFFARLQKRCKGTEDSPRIFGIGRGAQILLSSNLVDPKALAKLTWSEMFKDSGPWASAKIEGIEKPVQSLVLGRAVANSIQLEAAGFKSWIQINGENMGWKNASTGVHLSFVDALAYLDRSQLPGFGYEDLLGLGTASDVIDVMLKGWVDDPA